MEKLYTLSAVELIEKLKKENRTKEIEPQLKELKKEWINFHSFLFYKLQFI